MRQFDDDDCSDHDDYIHFTGPSRLAKAMHVLHGFVQGIAADRKVTDVEVKNLVKWLSAHREFADRHPFNEVIPRVQMIISDGIIDEEVTVHTLGRSKGAG